MTGLQPVVFLQNNVLLLRKLLGKRAPSLSFTVVMRSLFGLYGQGIEQFLAVEVSMRSERT